MSVPRPVVAGDTNLYTRRTHRREFRLNPHEVVTKTLGYLLAVLSVDHEVDLSAVCVEPTHHHTVGKDNRAVSPDFTRDFHSFAARALNAYFEESDSMWNGSQTSQVQLEEASDILDKIVYSLGNPVKDGLVEYGNEYPGLRVSWPSEPLVFERPPFWFNSKLKRKDGSLRWPDRAALVLHRPAGFDELTRDELIVELAARLRAFEEAERAERRKTRTPFIGAEALLARSRHGRPATREKRSGISPQIASKNKPRRIARLLARRLFRIEHEDSRVAFINGDRDVEFPHGTYQMRVRYRVNVAPAPTPPPG